MKLTHTQQRRILEALELALGFITLLTTVLMFGLIIKGALWLLGVTP